MIRLLLFEDNKDYREALIDAFEDSKEIFITKAFANANKAVKQIKEYQPDVVLMDIQMPGTSGLDALKQIREVAPETKILMQTQFKDAHRIFVALCRGALGYFLKSDSLDDLEKGIKDVHKGGGYFSGMVAGKVAKFFLDKEIQADPEYISLTERQLEVVEHLMKGLTYKGIAAEMFISYEAVHSHLQNIYKALHVTSKSAAILKIIEHKLV